MGVTELAVLRWLHILAMVYWLGGEWGVFNTSTHVINRKLSMEERRRHMQTAYNIDILARIGIISLLPLGLHMGHLWGGSALWWRLSCGGMALGDWLADAVCFGLFLSRNRSRVFN